jgi:hypothetical protein
LTDKSIGDGFQFYTTFYNAPLAVKVRHLTVSDLRMVDLCSFSVVDKGLMHAMIGMGVIGLIAKLHEWDESAIFFDGSSLGQLLSSLCQLSR